MAIEAVRLCSETQMRNLGFMVGQGIRTLAYPVATSSMPEVSDGKSPLHIVYKIRREFKPRCKPPPMATALPAI